MKLAKLLSGALIVGFATVAAVSTYHIFQKKSYRAELENTLDNTILEGKNEIGAMLLNKNCFHDSIEINKISEFKFDSKGLQTILRETRWGSQSFDHTPALYNVLSNKENRWYEFSDCATLYPFLIVAKKTDKGYDFFGDFILGVSWSSVYPDSLIAEHRTLHKLSELSHGLIADYTTVIYKASNSIFNDYINHIQHSDYVGVDIAKDTIPAKRDRHISERFKALYRLVKQYRGNGSTSLFFKVNDYYDLRPDTSFREAGKDSIINVTQIYEKDFAQLLAQKVVLHYSIYENSQLLRQKYHKKLWPALCITEALYFLMAFCLRKRYL